MRFDRASFKRGVDDVLLLRPLRRAIAMWWHDVRVTWEFWRLRHMRRDLRKRSVRPEHMTAWDFQKQHE